VPITYGPGSFLPLDVLRDGRVLFEAAYPLGENASAELYTVYTDGSGVEAYRCDHGHSRYAGRQLSSSDIVFARVGSLYRFTSALAHEIAIPAPAGTYAGDVIEMPDGAWLVSWHSAAQKNFELRKWKPGMTVLQPEIVESGANVIQPVLLTSRAIPNRHPSGLHEWSYANVLCLNAYTSKYRFADGSIASVRLYTRDTLGEPRLLGIAQVEKDGSFFLHVPGDQPLKVELLDKSGDTLKKEAGWFWMRGGEQRICVGCHAGPETAPENAVPAVLLRSTIPVDMTAGSQPSSGGGH
jgi:ketosteroid isomerase-like protein